MRGRDERAYERFSQAVELPMLVLALLFVPVIAVPLLFNVTEAVDAALLTASWMIWAAFAVEYLVKLYLAPDRGQMIRTHVLDLVIIVLPFLRPLRALRLLRVVAAGAALGRAGVSARRLLTRRGFSGFLVVVFGVIVVCGLLVWMFEASHPAAEIASPMEGLWWALVTATTVGYGDMTPLTPEGRGVAVLLMLVGIALLSVVTANIAAFFVEESDEQLQQVNAKLETALTRLERLEELITVSARRESEHP